MVPRRVSGRGGDEAGPPRMGRASDRGRPGGPGSGAGEPYLLSLFASATAWSRAACGATLLNRADSIALRTMSLTSALFGTVGTMSWYVATVSFASPRALSSIAVAGVEKKGSSYADGDDG